MIQAKGKTLSKDLTSNLLHIDKDNERDHIRDKNVTFSLKILKDVITPVCNIEAMYAISVFARDYCRTESVSV